MSKEINFELPGRTGLRNILRIILVVSFIIHTLLNLLPAEEPLLWKKDAGAGGVDIVITPTGDYIAAPDDLYQKSGEKVYTNAISEGRESVAISADGKNIAVCGNTWVYLLNDTNPVPVWSYKTEERVFNVDISTDGRYIAAKGCYYVYLFSKESSTPIWTQRIEGSGSNWQSVAISENGEYLVTGIDAPKNIGGLFLFSRSSSTPLWTYYSDWHYKTDISSAGSYLVSGDLSGFVNYFSVTSSSPLWKYNVGQDIYSVSMTPDGKYIAAGSVNSKVYFLSSSGTMLWTYPTGGAVYSVKISRDGNYVAAASGDNHIYLFRSSDGIPLWGYGTQDDVVSVDLSSDGSYVTARSEDNRLFLLKRDISGQGNTALEISPPGFNITVTSSVVFEARLKSGNNPVANKLITWSVTDGIIEALDAYSCAGGSVAVKYTAPTSTGPVTVKIRACFGGDGEYRYSQNEITVNVSTSGAQTVRSSIVIDGVSGFTGANGVVAGTGNENDPYIISGWYITATENEGLLIKNTTSHFVLKELSIKGRAQDKERHGISLVNLKNARIENVYINDAGCHGIGLHQVTDVTISSAVIRTSGRWGINVMESSRVKIADSIVQGNYEGGIALGMVEFSSITYNSISDNANHGVVVSHSSHNVISNNNSSNNCWSGIGFSYYASYNIAKNNICRNNGYSVFGGNGFQMKEQAIFNVVEDNYFADNDGFGVTGIINSNNNLIKNNYISGNDACGIEFNASTGNVIIGNIVLSSKQKGLFLNSTSEHTVKNNIFANNAEDGLRLSGLSGRAGVIENNTVYSNGQYGIYIGDTSSTTIKNNIVTNNTSGGILAVNSLPQISYNNFWNNGAFEYQGTSPGTGDISLNPYFIDAGNKNFHLLEKSPCLDSGDPASDYDQEPAPNGSRINMGSSGNTQHTDKSPVPPAGITDFSALPGINEGDINLVWKAPGDNGTEGDIVSGAFKIEYSTYNLSWSTGEAQITLSTSVKTGETQSYKITGLAGGLTYYIRIWAADSAGFWSGISNGATSYAQLDIMAPAAVTSLNAAIYDLSGRVILIWQAPGDDGLNGTLGTQDNFAQVRIQYSTYTGVVWDKNNYDFKVDTFGILPGINQSAIINTSKETTYYFRIWTRDEVSAGNWSEISNEAVLLCRFAPGIVTDLKAKYKNAEKGIELTWTATGDNGISDLLETAYFRIYSSTYPGAISILNDFNIEITTFNLNPGTVIAYNITGLTGKQNYFFRILPADKLLNWSGLSNSATCYMPAFTDMPVQDSSGIEKEVALKPGFFRIELPPDLLGENYYLVLSTSPTGEAIDYANQKDDLDKSINRINDSIIEINMIDTSGLMISSNLNHEARITFPYSDIDNDGIIDGISPALNEKTLNIFRLENNSWQKIAGSEVDTIQNKVSVKVNRFSIFVLMGSPAAENLNEAFCYPVPCKVCEKVIFKRLTSDAVISIYTLVGELVRTLENAGGDDQEDWDLKNSSGEKVAGGVYLYAVKDKKETRKGKLVIIR